MKSSQLLVGRCAVASTLAVSCIASATDTAILDPAAPHGTLTVDSNWIRIGMKSQLSWGIDYPAPIIGLADVVPPYVIKPKKDLKMKVRVIGACLQQAKSNNGHGNNADGVDSSNPGQGSGGPNGAIDLSNGIDDELKGLKNSYLPVEVLWSLNGATWTRLYYGTQNQVNSSKPVLDTTVLNGSSINFAARGWRDGAWLPLYSTAVGTANLVVLKNGDPIPSSVPALDGSSIGSYLKPYVDTVTKAVKIGDRDLIILMEIGQTSTASAGFDLQDVVILVTFE
ncbi:hypothetical protein [Luteolibacter soli]|uniref:Uncharacterized protein n=1 Tax=Luteolibacter soli TaxID=3135280 RepID=A0ABU9B1X2_9BACT